MAANSIKIEDYSSKKNFMINCECVSENSKEQYIYHILPLKYLIKMIDERKLYFSQIATRWEDPYELLGVRSSYESNSIFRFYGQSWSTNRDSDALWRIYSPDKMSVRVKTSIQKLCNLLDFDTKDYSIYIGNIDYKQKQDMEKNKKNQTQDEILRSLFVKRNNYSHENEVRLIVQLKNDNYLCEKFWKIDIEPSEIIYEVYFDPRIDNSYFKFLRNALCLKLPNATISQSPLYKKLK